MPSKISSIPGSARSAGRTCCATSRASAGEPAWPGRSAAACSAPGTCCFRWRGQDRSAAQFDPLRRRFKRLLLQGGAQAQCTRTANTCAKLLKLEPALWTFLANPDVPPTNHSSEQAIRALVLKRKISGPTRSRRGDEFIARGFSAHETCRRQGRDLWDYRHSAVVAWIDKTLPPSLLPLAAPSG